MRNEQTECKKFAARLIEAMLENGQQSQRKSATGVTTLKLKDVAKVTNEMARRYTLGQAWPDNEKMPKIARWLGVREAWLRYGEGEKYPQDESKKHQVALPGSTGDNSFVTVEEPEIYLNPFHITLLQDCMAHVVETRDLSGFEFSDRIAAKAAAVLFNHCVKYKTKPNEIPEEVRDAVLSTAAGSEG